jgi:hypothetical protein
MAQALALPAQTIDKLTTIGSAFGTGIVEAASYRAHPTAGTLVTFGGGLLGLLGAMTLNGRWAEVCEGIAASSAGSLGHFAIKAVWPGRLGLRSGNGRRPLGLGNPRELVGAGNPGNPGNPGRQEIMNEELLV